MIKKAQDVQNDNSHVVLYKIAQAMDFKIPDYVQSGIPLEKDASADVPDALFADMRNRRYPLTDKANTWLSAAYFAKTAADAYIGSEYRSVARRLLKAAELYRISDDVQNVMERITKQSLKEAHDIAEKEAEVAESCYGEPETNGFPMFNEEQVKMAQDYFDENAYSYDWRRREKIAKNIMRKVAEYGLIPVETVRKEAGAGFPRVDFLAENLLSRESELRRRGLDKMAGDMRRTIKIVCEADPEDLLRQLEPLREMISGSDELSGIDSEYGHRFLPPADFLFDVGDDEARDFHEDAIPMCGELMSAKALAGLPRRIFESVMPPSMIDGMMDGGHLSPKKVSITIIKMSPNAQHGLLDSIRDFTGNAGQECEVCDSDEATGTDEKTGKEDK